jgi:outer membrane protein assembly factor BamB
MVKRFIVLGIVCLATATVWADEFADQKAQNWHQWRGPLETGYAPHGNPPTNWDEQTNVKWKVELPGRGSASPIVWGDRIYVLSAIKTDRTADVPDASAASEAPSKVRLAAFAQDAPADQPGGGEERQRERRGRRGGFGGDRPAPTNFYQFVVICLDRHTSQIVWQKTACELVPHEGHHETASFASASPVTDGKHLYVSFGSRGIFCFDMDGNQKWNVDLGDMQTRAGFGEGASPALYGDTLVINWDHEGQSFITALDARTGETKWKVDRDEPTSWNTPLIVPHDGRMQVVVNGTNRARSYDLETGELIWECGGQTANPIPTSVKLDDVVYCLTGFRGNALYAIPLGSSGDITDTDKIAWHLDRATPYVSSPILHGGRLYFTKDRNAILSSVDAKTGDLLITEKRLPNMDTMYASPVGAADRIYFFARNGSAIAIKHSDELEILAENRLDDTIDASPAIVGNHMYLRGEKHLYCIAEE